MTTTAVAGPQMHPIPWLDLDTKDPRQHELAGGANAALNAELQRRGLDPKGTPDLYRRLAVAPNGAPFLLVDVLVRQEREDPKKMSTLPFGEVRISPEEEQTALASNRGMAWLARQRWCEVKPTFMALDRGLDEICGPGGAHAERERRLAICAEEEAAEEKARRDAEARHQEEERRATLYAQAYARFRVLSRDHQVLLAVKAREPRTVGELLAAWEDVVKHPTIKMPESFRAPERS